MSANICQEYFLNNSGPEAFHWTVCLKETGSLVDVTDCQWNPTSDVAVYTSAADIYIEGRMFDVDTEGARSRTSQLMRSEFMCLTSMMEVVIG